MFNSPQWWSIFNILKLLISSTDSLWHHFQCWHQWCNRLSWWHGNPSSVSLLSYFIGNSNPSWGISFIIYIFLPKGTFIRPHFQAIGGYTYHAGQSWKADSASIYGPIKSIAAADNSGTDLHVFMCKDTAFYGVIGVAVLGMLCKTSWPGYNVGVNEKRQNILATSEVHKKLLKLITVCTLFSTRF